MLLGAVCMAGPQAESLTDPPFIFCISCRRSSWLPPQWSSSPDSPHNSPVVARLRVCHDMNPGRPSPSPAL